MNNKDRTWYLISKKLSNEANAKELAELEELLRNDPEMHYALQHINDLWNLQSRTEPEAEEAFDRHLLRLRSGDADWQQESHTVELPVDDPFLTARPRRRRFLLPGAFVIILIAVAFFVYYVPGKKTVSAGNLPAASTKSEVSTRNGSRSKISLPDGSQVWLNSGSNIVYDKEFGNGLREVELSGEAFFDVVKNDVVPFIIHTKQVDIRVIGTAFNVRSYPGERQTATSLVRGLVEVTIHNRSSEKIMLQPNEKLVVTDPETRRGDSTSVQKEKNESHFTLGKLTYTRADSIVVETAWVQDKLVFDNEPFHEVAVKMERWYNVKFEFRDSITKNFHFTGVFQNETIQQALEGLRITAGYNFRYAMEGNKVIIRRNNFLTPNLPLDEK